MSGFDAGGDEADESFGTCHHRIRKLARTLGDLAEALHLRSSKIDVGVNHRIIRHILLHCLNVDVDVAMMQ